MIKWIKTFLAEFYKDVMQNCKIMHKEHARAELKRDRIRRKIEK